CIHAARMAIAFRQRFREDVIIDLVCYRRHGHNEGDDPTFTQPLLYQKIAAHSRVGRIHMDRLLEAGAVSGAEVSAIESEIQAKLDGAMEESQGQVKIAL